MNSSFMTLRPGKKAVEGDSDQEDLEETTSDFIQLKNDLGRMRKKVKEVCFEIPS